MRIKRRLPLVTAVLLVAGAVALAVVLRKHAPPEPARLLPGADGFFYVNLKWIRRANIAGQLAPVPHDSDYDQFLQATGFQFERDLDQAAFAIHYPASLREGKASPSDAPRFSEIFVGKIDGDRLRAYLRKIAGSVESDGSVDIYSIPLEERTLRVAILSVDTVAASNHPDPQVIRGIVDRSRKLASPFGGPALLRQYYKNVPIASLAWAIFKVDPATAYSLSASPVNLSFLFSKPAVIVASSRDLLGVVHLRSEAFTESEAEAKHAAEQLGAFLSIFHAAESAVAATATDPDVKQFLDSLKVEQHNTRAVLTATVPPGFIRKAIAQAPGGLEPAQPTARPSGK